MVITLPKITQEEADELQSALELDLMAYYKSLRDELLEALEEHKDKPIDDIIHEVSKKI